MEGDETQTESERVRTYVGALMIVSALRELTSIRKLLTAPE